jgi:medium-chain acyl-[acyl-carrier-protein] hydrolase
MSTSLGSPWLTRLRAQPVASPVLRLLCFHHAGGGAASYRPWLDAMPEGVELCAVQLPGRESRLREAPFTRLGELVPVLTDALRPALDRPVALFGHSLGALVAFEVARELARRGQPLPAHLFLSGRKAPGLPPHERVSHLPTAELVAQVRRRWDGIPAAVLAEPELLALLLPTLRADLELVETHVHVPGPPLDCPISCFGGTTDPSASAADLAGWRAHTTKAFSVRMLPGSHFFVQAERPRVLAAVAEDLQPLLDPARRLACR